MIAVRWTAPSYREIVLAISQDELVILNNCMNEALERIPDSAFQTLIGVEKPEVGQLLSQFRPLWAELERMAEE